jgi:hypothetical protein
MATSWIIARSFVIILIRTPATLLFIVVTHINHPYL